MKKIIAGSDGPFKKPFYANKHRAEKNRQAGPIGHYCSLIYPTYFEPIKDEDINILEIGVYEGNSLRMWRDYFTKANIYGLDINPACKFEEDRIKVFIGDQSDPTVLTNIVDQIEKIDIIIDDGSHISKHQIKSFETLFPFLSYGGLYIIEDLFLSYNRKWGEAENNPGGRKLSGTIIEYLKDYVDKAVLAEDKIDYIHFYRSIVLIRKQEI